MRIASVAYHTTPVLAAVIGMMNSAAIGMPAVHADLLRHATFVARTSNWWGCRSLHGIVQWLSDDVLVHSRFSGPRGEGVWRSQVGSRRTVWRLELRTRRSQRMRGLERAIDAYDGEVVDAQGLSPDGKWLVRSLRWDMCAITDTRGPHWHYWVLKTSEDDWYRDVVWLPDSQHWLDRLYFNGVTKKLVLHDVANPSADHVIPLGDKAELFCSIERIYSPDRALALVEPDKDLELAEPNQSVSVYELSLDASKPARKVATVPVPHGSPEFYCSLSPQGDRILWEVATRPSEKTRCVEVLVCNVDGTRLHSIGSVTAAVADRSTPRPYLDAEWLPSGYRIAFMWKDNLYRKAVK